MKNIKYLLVLATVMLAGLTANAQRGFDLFAIPTTVTMPGTNVTTGVAPPGYTNQPVDIHGMAGIGVLRLWAFTNVGTAGGLLTATVQQSSDTTNWSTLNNFAVVTNTTAEYYTNRYYLGTPVTTNFVLRAGTLTTPLATSGETTPYLAPLPMTNNAAIPLGLGLNIVGFNVQDALRYIRVIWAASGTATNWTFYGDMTGYRSQMTYVNP